MRHRALGAAAIALGLVATLSSVASAAPDLPDSQWVSGTGSTTYTATTTAPYWSAVLAGPGNNADGLSVAGTGTTFGFDPDYVAIDGNVRAAQHYTVSVSTLNPYRLEFLNGHTILNAGLTTLTPPTTDIDNGYIRDMYLYAGNRVQIVVGESGVTCAGPFGTFYTQAYLLGDDPATPATAVQNQASALAHAQSPWQTPEGCGVTLTYSSVPRSGWYGLLIFGYGSSPVAVSFNQSHHAPGGGG